MPVLLFLENPAQNRRELCGRGHNYPGPVVKISTRAALSPELFGARVVVRLSNEKIRA